MICREKITKIFYLTKCESWVSGVTRLFYQRAKKVVSDSPGLLNFAMELVNSVFNLPDRQVMFLKKCE